MHILGALRDIEGTGSIGLCSGTLPVVVMDAHGTTEASDSDDLLDLLHSSRSPTPATRRHDAPLQADSVPKGRGRGPIRPNSLYERTARRKNGGSAVELLSGKRTVDNRLTGPGRSSVEHGVDVHDDDNDDNDDNDDQDALFELLASTSPSPSGHLPDRQGMSMQKPVQSARGTAAPAPRTNPCTSHQSSGASADGRVKAPPEKQSEQALIRTREAAATPEVRKESGAVENGSEELPGVPGATVVMASSSTSTVNQSDARGRSTLHAFMSRIKCITPLVGAKKVTEYVQNADETEDCGDCVT